MSKRSQAGNLPGDRWQTAQAILSEMEPFSLQAGAQAVMAAIPGTVSKNGANSSSR